MIQDGHKKCGKCKELKPVAMFGKHSRHSDGLQSHCKMCKAAKDKAYHKANRDRIKKKAHDYYLNHKDVIVSRVRKYEVDNRETVAIKRSEYYQANKGRWSQYNKERSKIDPVFSLKLTMRKAICKVMSGKHKSKRSEEIIGCSYVELKNYIESQFEPWMSWENKGLYNRTMNYGWDIDHIIPLCTAKTEEDIYRLNHYTNLRPLCSYVNRNIKRDRYEPVE